MKKLLLILGILLLLSALTLQLTTDQPLITIGLLWIYVTVRELKDFF
jgi:hypothetical protein